MKSSRFYFLLTVSFVLLFLFFVLGSWVYKSYFNEEEMYTGELIVLKPIDSLVQATPAKEPVSKAKFKKDYRKLETTNQSIAVRENTATENKQQVAGEIIHLKEQIDALIKKQPNQKDLLLAKQQIDVLHQQIENLVGKNSEVENANKKLLQMLRNYVGEKELEDQKIKPWPAVFENKHPDENVVQLSRSKNSVPVAAFKNNTSGLVSKKEDKVSTTVVESNPFAGNIIRTENIRLLAMTETDNKDIETNQAYQTDKLVGYITLKSNQSQVNPGEIFVVVFEPNGHVIQKSSWESGSFQHNAVKKIYSLKLRFHNLDEKNKTLTFSLPAANYVKGNYIMEIYTGGELIGKTVKKLD